PVEGAARVPRDVQVVALHQPPDHLYVRVEELGNDAEVVVVDDGGDLAPDSLEPRFHRLSDVLDVPLGADRHTLEVEEKDVAGLVIAKPRLERQREQILAQAHRPVGEDSRVHRRKPWAHERREFHLREDVALEVDSRSDLDQFQSTGDEPEDAALGDEDDGLLPADRVVAAERALLDLVDELRHPELAAEEGAHEDDLLRVLADVDEPAGAGEGRPELADVDVALSIGLCQPEECDVEATAVVEV